MSTIVILPVNCSGRNNWNKQVVQTLTVLGSRCYGFSILFSTHSSASIDRRTDQLLQCDDDNPGQTKVCILWLSSAVNETNLSYIVLFYNVCIFINWWFPWVAITAKEDTNQKLSLTISVPCCFIHYLKWLSLLYCTVATFTFILLVIDLFNPCNDVINGTL